ncbi:uncharacterized protein LOC127379618 [Dicentrarchus labrax]|uniref:uncharacterized protein LOC127379618 n=1 Tax=Dicentrarchus labrax TaxID=13489 RepID=UPI0021F5C58D|nr:uncharacterized protein LOC127379618 [Dicentrarchus labrax]XP_051285389.1 uncharacterized protein LOC127379618 [Dicentrarchus labrax]
MCEEVSGLKMLLLLSCWIIAGITAEEPTRHYRLKNSSLCLQIGKSPPYEDIRWRFNNTAVVLRNNVTPNFKNKVDYNLRNHSLCINKLTEMDSGTYEVVITDPEFAESTETHKLIVEETVPRPVIKMSVMHSNLSAGFCKITVNCSVQNDWMLSVCDADSCRPSQTSFKKVNITMSPFNRSVVCRGNNHVSTSSVYESIETTCSNKSNSEQEETFDPLVVIIILPIMFGTLFLFIFCVAKGYFSSQYNHHQAQTSPAQLTQTQPVEAQPQAVLRVSSSSSSDGEACYENVDAAQPSQTSSQIISPRSQEVDTVYSYLQTPNPSFGKSDAKGQMKLQEVSTSQSVTLDEAGQPIDTVYSVLQKTKNHL